ncbi:hypothetical protein CN902_24115 [Priestia megaterium]|uniref:DUF2726 domain-containing protein n=1 Tax=Priestia megaterium TaxID=1404 RepID=UPI000BFDAC88|nr:DUF2726 domain-containing protein [Priestia megaterium]PGK25182.1 hypothetical protein CN902_24115 [Priestia megaterium]
MRKKTHEEFVKEVYEKMGNEYLVKGRYLDSKTKIKVKHLKCGHEYMVQPTKIVNAKRGCPKCNHGGNPMKTHEEFKQQVFELVKDEYQVLGKYNGSSQHIKMRHNKCGNIYHVAPNKFIYGRRCPKCKGGVSKSAETFIKEVYDLYGDEYEVVGEYKNARTLINLRHHKCGKIYKVTPDSFTNAKRTCGFCYGRYLKTQEIFLKEVFDLVGNEYEVLGEYTRTHGKIKMRHNLCGYEYEVAPSKFLSGRRCPRCKESRGESIIADYLNRKGIEYLQYHRIDDCRHILPLSFDFTIFNNGKILLIIEFDGRQHFEPVDAFGGQVGFELTQKRDEIKNKYCIENNIPLIRIPHWEYNDIEDILEESIQSLVSEDKFKGTN